MKDNIFKRVEQKYILSKWEYDNIQKIINEYFLKDRYYQSKIANIYYDNDNNDMLITSLEKPIFKKKIRVRSYGEDDSIYFEIKEKYDDIVYKRRVKLLMNEYNNYLIGNKISNSNQQIMREIDYYVNYYKIHPYVYVAYDRLSYYSKDDFNFRITFDNNLRYRFNNLDCCCDEDTIKYFDSDKYIMEVKCLNSLPYWFVKYLSSNKIYPTSFSKVGSIYMKERGFNLC